MGHTKGTPELIAAYSSLRGGRDMLRECAKQFRAMGSPDGHAKMADLHADGIDGALSAIAKACNAHDDLLEALKYLIQGRPGEAMFDRLYDTRVAAARAAIAKAEER